MSRDRLHKLREGKFIEGERLESLRQATGYAEIRDENRPWFYPNEQIVRFLFACRGELDLRKVNQVWLMGLLESYVTLFQITPKQARQAERERTKLAHRRLRKQSPKTKRRSTSTSRPSLGDPVLDTIRPAGRPSSAAANVPLAQPPLLPHTPMLDGTRSRVAALPGIRKTGTERRFSIPFPRLLALLAIAMPARVSAARPPVTSPLDARKHSERCPSGVMPYALCTAFSESREYAQLQAQYHDGTTERSQLAQTSRRTFKLAQRLTAARARCAQGILGRQQGGVVPFLFYNLAEGPYDATGELDRKAGTRSCSAATGRRPPACCARTCRRSNS